MQVFTWSRFNAYTAFIVVFVAFAVLSVLLIQALWRNRRDRSQTDLEPGTPPARLLLKQPEII